ncbi:MAG: helix-turn-helix domain-containing protein [Clostridia bacterium]|nr:helix-turn-helix domain-containing protein [Clostridia bacterium]
MDLKITGKFIKDLRKEKGLTQVELATKLNVSEKTISKWECGGGFPDTSLILPLCECLGISANELLSGKKLQGDDYKKEAENNIISLKAKDEHNTKLLLTIEWVLGYLSLICLLTFVYVPPFLNIAEWVKVLLAIFGFVQFIFGVHFCLMIEKDAGYYECPHCGHKHIPKYGQMLWSMHMGRTRYIKCPHCGKRGWNKKVIK